MSIEEQMNVDERRKYLPNGERYLLVGGRGLRSLCGKMFRHRKLLENAQTPTSQVHALLGCFRL